MSVGRGDVVLLYVPFVDQSGGKVRPALVVQSDVLNQRLGETIVAVVTSNVTRAHLPHQVFVDVATPAGIATGLLRDSVVRCDRLHMLAQTEVRRTLGRFDGSLMQEVDEGLKSALGIV